MGRRIGIIGGTGLYELRGLEDVRALRVETPYGDPSDTLLLGRLGDAELVFLPRHGRGHRINPSEVNYRANIWALKSLGVEWVIAVSAVGSLREEIAPGHVVTVDQFIDRTKGRDATFFEDGVVAHVSFGDPICPVVRGVLAQAAKEAGAVVHPEGTYVCMEGPAFSTRAESNLYRSWGASVIGMTNLTEAKLAREAELSFATLALVTDYDCWFDGHDAVTSASVMEVLSANVSLAREVLALAIPVLAAYTDPPPMSSALEHALLTPAGRISPEVRERLGIILGKYLR
ncbi:MAG: S-methyl-5'-thioadenosine phosphorylase [Deltaproteobacteria bacterium]|nr:S-methyl-5'-thioadenosine phosphorylase [Deltaproteobacteria bacterium]